MQKAMYKILVFGANGMLGKYVYLYLKKNTNHDVRAIERSEFDVQHNTFQDLYNLMSRNDVDSNTVVFNGIGSIPHAGVQDPRVFYMVNTVFPMMLSVVCKAFDCKLIHPSTDCVYSGKKGEYTENDPHDDDSPYGMSKSYGEEIDATIIRTSIIGENEKGISLLEWVKKSRNKKVVGYANHYWNGITCLQYAKLIKEIIDRNMFWNGVRHVCSPNAVTKAQLVELISTSYCLNVTIFKTNVEHCDRTLSTVYPNLFNIPPLEEQIHELASFSLV